MTGFRQNAWAGCRWWWLRLANVTPRIRAEPANPLIDSTWRSKVGVKRPVGPDEWLTGCHLITCGISCGSSDAFTQSHCHVRCVTSWSFIIARMEATIELRPGEDAPFSRYSSSAANLIPIESPNVLGCSSFRLVYPSLRFSASPQTGQGRPLVNNTCILL